MFFTDSAGGELMAIRQLPVKVDVECVAGDPMTITFTASSGVTAFTSPVTVMTTSAGDSYATDPGVPTVSASTTSLVTAWSAADTAALNTTTRAKTYKYSTEALADGQGAFQVYAGTITVHPVGTAGVGTSTTQTAALTLGGASVTGDVTLAGGATHASGLIFTPAGTISSTNTQAAVEEVAADAATALAAAISGCQPLDAELTALASTTSAANKLPYFTGSGAATTTDLTAAGRALIGAADAAAQRTALALGSIATQAAGSVAITGGSVAGITDLAVADGGTGASDAATARSNLGLSIGGDVMAASASWRTHPIGRWSMPLGAVYSTGTIGVTVGFQGYVPVLLPPGTYNRIRFYLATPASAGGLARLGLYADDAGGVAGGGPGTLLADGGTVATDGAAGFKEVTISYTTAAQRLVWMTIVTGVATPQIYIAALPGGSGGGLNNATQQSRVMLFASGGDGQVASGLDATSRWYSTGAGSDAGSMYLLEIKRSA